MMPGRALLTTVLTLCGLTLCGCALDDRPKWRIGSSPYPRTNSYLAALDPEDLGPHRYDSLIPRFDAEKSRGEVYTCRGGFIDLSHARHVTDWTRYIALRARRAIERGRPRMRAPGSDHSAVEVTLTYPDWWADLPADERDDLTNALALRIGQQVAYALQTYHEIQTWYGYRYVPIWAEWDSAFCYDDMISHVVGLRTAGAALDGGRRLTLDTPDYNRAVEAAYAAEMKLLEAVPPERTWAAIRAVEGDWYGDDVPVKRQVDAGYDDGVLEAWTIPDFACGHADHAAGDMAPFAFALPSLADVRGRDLSGMAQIDIIPGLIQRRRLVRTLGWAGSGRLRVERDFERLIRAVREEARERLGERAVSPPEGIGEPAKVLGG